MYQRTLTNCLLIFLSSQSVSSQTRWFSRQEEFLTSNLPIVLINTPPGELIKNEPKITVDLSIIHNGDGTPNMPGDPANIYSGKAGIEIRGRYSASLPQKPYGFETRTADGVNLDTSLLGLPAENDWILLANYNDKTFLRNYLAFELFRDLGHYAPRSFYCEVLLNNEYQGIYLLTEKIKADKNRVNIASLRPDENSGDDLTGGYIFKNDYYTANDSWISDYSPLNKPGATVRFVYHDPESDELTPQQKQYLQGYVDHFEQVLYSGNFADPLKGYRAFIDVDSFIDYFLIGEISRNVDAYKKSRYFYKDKDSKGGLLHSGPVWDFDWAWRNLKENCVHFNKTDGSGWAYKINECYASPVPPSWEIRLMQDRRFVMELREKYYILRKNILSESHIFSIIDSVAALLDEAQTRHYTKWDILGINVGTPESGPQPETYQGEIEKFKAWISTRLTWLDANMAGKSFVTEEGYKPACRIYPVPASEWLMIESDTTITKIELFDAAGNKLKETELQGVFGTRLPLNDLSQGFYIVRISFTDCASLTRRFMKIN
jgi:hypothetical protein